MVKALNPKPHTLNVSARMSLEPQVLKLAYVGTNYHGLAWQERLSPKPLAVNPKP